MVGRPIVPPDVEQRLCDHMRTLIADGVLPAGTWVGSDEPPVKKYQWLVRVVAVAPRRDSFVQMAWDMGFTVIGPDGYDTETQRAALDLIGYLDQAVDGDPLTAVLDVNGPGRVVDEDTRPKRYVTATLLARGSHP